MKRKLLFAILLLALASCQKEQGSEVIVARIGDEVITAEEFQLNYEFGHGHLRQGDNPRRSYLDLMISEKVLAMEAEKIDLDTTQAVIHAMHTLREELLIERVFEEKVLASVEVTAEEIRDEINRAAVSFQFRILPAHSEFDAQRLYEAVLEKGYVQVLEERREEFAELSIIDQELTSPLLRAEDIEPVILEILKDLEVNTPSKPVEYNGYWYIFEVIDIQQERLSDADYEERAPTYRKVIYNRKAMEGGQAFVARTMEPLNVVTKRQGFEVLNEALWEWYSAETPMRNLLHYIEEQGRDTPYTRQLVAHYAADLVHFGDEQWSIRTFLEHFTPGRYTLRARDPGDFTVRLADVVALVVRDAVFLKIAEEEQLYDQPQHERSLALWKDKWMFQEYRKVLLDSSAITDAEVKAYYRAMDRKMEGEFYPYDRLSVQDRDRIKQRMMQDRITGYADSVLTFHEISINESVLDSLPLSVSTANPYMTVHLLKSNSNKMPFPIVDPGWKAMVRE